MESQSWIETTLRYIHARAPRQTCIDLAHFSNRGACHFGVGIQTARSGGRNHRTRSSPLKMAQSKIANMAAKQLAQLVVVRKSKRMQLMLVCVSCKLMLLRQRTHSISHRHRRGSLWLRWNQQPIQTRPQRATSQCATKCQHLQKIHHRQG